MNEKKSSKAKKDMAKSVHKARYLMMKITTWKTTSRGTFRVDVSKLRDFSHKLYIKFFPTLETLYLSIFFLIFILKTIIASSYRKMCREIRRVKMH